MATQVKTAQEQKAHEEQTTGLLTCFTCKAKYQRGPNVNCCSICGQVLPGSTLSESQTLANCFWCGLQAQVKAEDRFCIGCGKERNNQPFDEKHLREAALSIDRKLLICQVGNKMPLCAIDERVSFERLARALQRAQLYAQHMPATAWFDELYKLPRTKGDFDLVSYALNNVPPVHLGLGCAYTSQNKIDTWTVVVWFIMESIARKFLLFDEDDPTVLRYCPNALSYYQQAYGLSDASFEDIRFHYDLRDEYEKKERGEIVREWVASNSFVLPPIPKTTWGVLVARYKNYGKNILAQWNTIAEKPVTTLRCGYCQGVGKRQYASYPCETCNGTGKFAVASLLAPPVAPVQAQQSLPSLIACFCGQIVASNQVHPIVYKCERDHVAQPGESYCSQDATPIHAQRHLHYCYCGEPIKQGIAQGRAKSYCAGCGALIQNQFMLDLLGRVPNTPPPVLRVCYRCGTKTWDSLSECCPSCLTVLPVTKAWQECVNTLYPWQQKARVSYTWGGAPFHAYKCPTCGYIWWAGPHLNGKRRPYCEKCNMHFTPIPCALPSVQVLPMRPVLPPMQQSEPARVVEGSLTPIQALPAPQSDGTDREIFRKIFSIYDANKPADCPTCLETPGRTKADKSKFCPDCGGTARVEQTPNTNKMPAVPFGFAPRNDMKR